MYSMRVIIGVLDHLSHKTLQRKQYIGNTQLEPYTVSQRVSTLLASLKNDGFFVRTYRDDSRLIMLIELLDNIGETDPETYVRRIAEFSTPTEEPVDSLNPEGYLVGTTDHPGLFLDQIVGPIAEPVTEVAFTAQLEFDSEYGAGDAFSQFLIGLAVTLTAKGAAALVDRIRKALGETTGKGIVATTFQIASFIAKLSKRTGVEGHQLQLVEMQTLPNGHYRFLTLSPKMIIRAECDGNANILKVAEEQILLPRKTS
jgi:hypothetical protein